MNQPKKKSRQQTPARKAGIILFRAIMTLGIVTALALASFLVWSLATGGVASNDGAKTTPEVTGAPKLKVDRDKIDLGDIKLGRTVQAEFVLSNVGDRPLQITDKPYIEVLEGC